MCYSSKIEADYRRYVREYGGRVQREIDEMVPTD